MDGSGVGSHSSLFTKSQVYDLLTPRAERHVGDIEIGTSTIVGRNVTVLPGVSIGPNCVIGAGCVISESIGDQIILVSYGSRTFKKDG
jgi:acetyltransferase-like isoleucine patch superfamily enzyme